MLPRPYKKWHNPVKLILIEIQLLEVLEVIEWMQIYSIVLMFYIWPHESYNFNQVIVIH